MTRTHAFAIAGIACLLLWHGVAAGDSHGGVAELAQMGIESYAAALDTEERSLRLEGFRRAQRLFARVAEDQGHNPELYTNLGNAALQAEHLGVAVLAYRRALAIDPSYPRAVQNLEFARTLLPEWVPRPQTGLLDSFFFWHRTMARSDRALFAAVAFLIAGLLVAASFRFGQSGWRNAAILPGLVWLVVLGSVAIDLQASALDEAVLVADETVARAADSALAPAALPAALPAGAEVTIVETRSPWLRIRLANGRDAWISESAAVPIPR